MDTVKAQVTAPARVLVVDDDAANRRLVSSALGAGYAVLEADSGPAALAAVDDGGVDLVLLDVMMPGLSGFEVCRRIKRERDGQDFLPVILLTALSSRSDRISGLAAGADDFLSKPIDQRILRLRVATLLKVRHQETRIRAQLQELGELQQLKDDLFSLVVHDLRNPLSGVMGYLELLRGGVTHLGDARLLGFAEGGLQSADELRRLIDSVLQVRRLEEASVPVEREEVHLRGLLEDALRGVRGAASMRNVQLELEASADDPVATLDPVLVRRALENLIANALKVSPAGSLVRVSARRVGERVELEVADQGPGLSAEEKRGVFEKFSTGDRRKGFGLGLHLVKLVIEAHAGELVILDREERGAVFRLVFEA